MTLKFKTTGMNKFPVELIFWITALALLAIAEPHHHLHESHFTFCPLANLGLEWCPGCGLGRSITNFFHGNVKDSLHQHWFGIPAVFIIGYRIVTLVQLQKQKIYIKNKENNYV